MKTSIYIQGFGMRCYFRSFKGSTKNFFGCIDLFILLLLSETKALHLHSECGRVRNRTATIYAKLFGWY